MSGQIGLSDVLENHKRKILLQIKGISDLDQMTDAFLEGLVQKSLVEPLTIHFDGMTHKRRTETLDASYLPEDSMGGRRFRAIGNFPLDGGNQKQVTRLIIPFSGDPTLPKYAPNPCDMDFPQGEIHDHTIQFDVILWGSPEDGQRLKSAVQKSRERITKYADAINQQVKSFNESLPPQIKAAFAAKLEELTRQYAAFEELGIPEVTEPPEMPTSPVPAKPKTAKAQVVHINQFIDKMFVQQLNQTNNNIGDVNNDIQSN